MLDKKNFLEDKYPGMVANGDRINELVKDVRNIALAIYSIKTHNDDTYKTLAKVLIERCNVIENREENIFSILYDVKNSLEEENDK